MAIHPFRLFWRAQDWLRRRINRFWYCSVGVHRRTGEFSPCKDCEE